MTLVQRISNITNIGDCNLSIVIADDDLGDYSVMTLVECGDNKRLFNRLLIEDYKGGEIYAF